MRRTAVVRLALVAATIFLAACADLSTGPQAPESRRDVQPGTGVNDTTRASDTVNTRGANQQGSSV